jgi:hypothetical protein
MPLNFNVGAVGAMNRPGHTFKSSAKHDSAAPDKARQGDTAEVSGRGALGPAPAEFGLDEALAALASLKPDIVGNPGAALAAQANVRPQVGIVLAG